MPAIGQLDRLGNLISKIITLDLGAVPVTETLFTVTGEVEVAVCGYIDIQPTAVGALTLEVGVAGDTAGIIAQTGKAVMLIDLLWMDAAPAVLITQPAVFVISNGLDIAHIIAGDDATDGKITYYCWWRPVSPDGLVVPA